jgi:iron complex outermembrane receptor protein
MTRQSSATLIYIRGIGTGGGQAGQEAAVATFVDGVYLPSMTGSTLSFNNIAQIEVLKGPQGTLFGRNATGGAINIVTSTPQVEPAFKGEISVGNYDTTEGALYATGGSGSVAADIALFFSDQNEGFGNNLIDGKDVNARKDQAVRSKLLWEASDTTTVTLGGDYSRTDGSSGIATRQLPGTTSLLGETGWPYDFYDIRADVTPDLNIEAWGGSVNVEHVMGDYALTSITAYRNIKQDQTFDLDLTPVPLLIPDLHEFNDQLTQELQLAFESESVNWMVGLFYMDATNEYDPFTITGLALAPFAGTSHKAEQDTKSYAAFGQATFELTEATNITVGARYTVDQREINAGGGLIDATGATVPIPGVSPYSVSDDTTWSEPTWRLALDHRFNDSLMGYVSYNRGFKSGVYNLTAPNDAKVDPEILDAFEVGVKSDLFDRRVRFNTSAFFYKYDNIQATIIRGASQTLLNAAEAEVYGLDFDFMVAVTDNWTLNGGGAWMNAEYKNFENGNLSIPNPAGGNTILENIDISGNDMIKAPDFTFSVSSDYVVPLSSGELGFNVTYFYTDSYYWDPDNRIEQDAYGLLNAQIKWTAPGGNYYVRVFGRNLTDEEYFSQITVVNTGDLGVAAPPRTYGMGVGVNF